MIKLWILTAWAPVTDQSSTHSKILSFSLSLSLLNCKMG